MDEALELGYNVDQTEIKEIEKKILDEAVITGNMAPERGIQSDDVSLVFILGTFGGMIITVTAMALMRLCKNRQPKENPVPSTYKNVT